MGYGDEDGLGGPPHHGEGCGPGRLNFKTFSVEGIKKEIQSRAEDNGKTTKKLSENSRRNGTTPSTKDPVLVYSGTGSYDVGLHVAGPG